MGIKGLMPFLKKKGYVAKTIMMESLRDKSIAVDTFDLIHKYFYVSTKEELNAQNVVNDTFPEKEIRERVKGYLDEFSRVLMIHGIIPIFVFDGKKMKEKKLSRENRKKEFLKKVDKANKLYEKIRKEIEVSPFIRKTELIDEYIKAKSTCTEINKETIIDIKNFLYKRGKTVLQAKGEGEKLCVELERSGLVSAVYSKDTDCLAMGSKMMINSIERKLQDSGEWAYCAQYHNVDEILPKLEISFNKFQDLCIMCGCDFNNNIFRLGPSRCFNLLKKHGNLKQIIENEKSKDFSILNYEICKDFFGNIKNRGNMEKILEKFSYIPQ